MDFGNHLFYLLVKARLRGDPRDKPSVIKRHDIESLGANVPIRSNDIAQALSLEHWWNTRDTPRQNTVGLCTVPF